MLFYASSVKNFDYVCHIVKRGFSYTIRWFDIIVVTIYQNKYNEHIIFCNIVDVEIIIVLLLKLNSEA